MRFIILGASRTGTTSLGKALTILGYNVHSISKCFAHPADFHKLTDAIEQKQNHKSIAKGNLESISSTYDAAHGLAIAALADDLLAAYSDAEVILTIRNSASWIESWFVSVMYYHQRWHGWRHYVFILAGGALRAFQEFREAAINVWSFGRPFDRIEQRVFFEEYCQHIKNVVPKDRLLVYEVKQGWKPLGEFLGVDVPEGVAFPHATAREDLHPFMQRLWERAVWKAAVRIGVTCAVVVALAAGLLPFVSN
jgi:hypothetical protein